MKKELKNNKPFIFLTIGVIFLTIFTSSLTTIAVLNLKSQFILDAFIEASNKNSINLEKKAVTSSQTVIGDELSTEQAVDKVKPAVVSIIIKKEITQNSISDGDLFDMMDPFSNGPFKFFFPNRNPNRDPNNNSTPEPKSNKDENKEKTIVGGGTGFFISRDGLILTNKHVVEDEDSEYIVMTDDGKELEAEVKARDPFFDLAILKVKGSGFPVVLLGDSDNLKVGQTVLAIGNALAEFGGTVTKGIISAKERSTVVSSRSSASVERLEGVLQTDASINPGNSGGPLVNMSGEAIGMNTAVAGDAQGIGFAIPINDVKTAIETFKEKGKIIRPQLGLRYRVITQSLAEKNNLKVKEGALVAKGDDPEELAVIPGGPADKAGITENDIILEVNGEKVTENMSLTRLIQKNAVNAEIKLKILHDSEEKEVLVKLEESSK